jgi:hypothetical protein
MGMKLPMPPKGEDCKANMGHINTNTDRYRPINLPDTLAQAHSIFSRMLKEWRMAENK